MLVPTFSNKKQIPQQWENPTFPKVFAKDESEVNGEWERKFPANEQLRIQKSNLEGMLIDNLRVCECDHELGYFYWEPIEDFETSHL